MKGEAPLDHEQHKQHRRLVGKIQWLAHTRPNTCYGAKKLARSLQAPTQLDNKKLKRMIRRLKGTRYMRHTLQPKIQIQDKRIHLNIDTYTYARQQGRTWSSNTLWHQNTSNNRTFIRRIRTVHNWYSSTKSLYIRNFINEAFEVRTDIRIHTDSCAAKPISMREGTSKKAKHIELRHLFVQQLVKSKIITMHKVKSEGNPADILTKFVSCAAGTGWMQRQDELQRRRVFKYTGNNQQRSVCSSFTCSTVGTANAPGLTILAFTSPNWLPKQWTVADMPQWHRQALSLMSVNHIKHVPAEHQTTLVAPHFHTRCKALTQKVRCKALQSLATETTLNTSGNSRMCSSNITVCGEQEQGVLGVHHSGEAGQDTAYAVRYICHNGTPDLSYRSSAQ